MAGVLLATSITVFAQAVDLFNDDSKLPSWSKDAIYQLKNEGLVNGYGDGYFRPNQNITRAEVAVMINNLYEYNIQNIEDLIYTIDRYDVPKEYKVPIVMARLGLKKIDQATANHYMSDETVDYELKDGEDQFDVYFSQVDDGYGEYIVHYVADGYSYADNPNGVDAWFGPFSNL